MNIVICIKGGSVDKVLCDEYLPKGSELYIVDEDIPRYDSGEPVIAVITPTCSPGDVWRIIDRYNTEPDDDLSVHGCNSST